MRGHLDLYVPAVAGVIAAIVLWVVLARALSRRGKSRWRPVLLCLPLVLVAAGYGLFWFGFFSSPDLAVTLRAVQLTIQHEAGAFIPWIIGGWAALSALLLLPLLKSQPAT
jgi:glucan phosphoethanolaminetransferase (alkaline phosphatase superfamily)